MPPPIDAPPVRHAIRIAAGLVVGGGRRVLLVRKHGTTAFMQPGGKIEPGETPVAALIRELNEELGLVVSQDSPLYLGSYAAPAANEPEARVAAELFQVAIVQDIRIAAEIAEARWIDPSEPLDIELAPLTRDHVLPAYRAMLGKTTSGGEG